ncbi:hypothetical protein ACQKNS_09215 [Peribacillus sp. NPDC094092]|uniref:hypothetical protein n=1 Tax=Peribacillus sp. NPDC094092 TaxID=3390611 RepID=UPI003D00D7B4
MWNYLGSEELKSIISSLASNIVKRFKKGHQEYLVTVMTTLDVLKSSELLRQHM